MKCYKKRKKTLENKIKHPLLFGSINLTVTFFQQIKVWHKSKKKTHHYCTQNVGMLTDVNFHSDKNYGQTIHMGGNEIAKETNSVGKYLLRVCAYTDNVRCCTLCVYGHRTLGFDDIGERCPLRVDNEPKRVEAKPDLIHMIVGGCEPSDATVGQRYAYCVVQDVQIP